MQKPYVNEAKSKKMLQSVEYLIHQNTQLFKLRTEGSHEIELLELEANTETKMNVPCEQNNKSPTSQST